MFAVSSRDLPRLDDYAAAHRHWDKTKPWRGRRDKSTRPLSSNRRREINTIRKQRDDSIACVLYSTDVLTYHPDGRLTLRSYASMSTSSFASRIAPAGVWAHFTAKVGPVLWLGAHEEARGYHVPDNLTLVRDGAIWVPETPPVPFERYHLDQPRARAALKEYRYTEFMDWRAAWLELASAERRTEAARQHILQRVSTRDMLEYLRAGPGRWDLLAACDDKVLLSLRRAIYARADCIEVTPVPYLTSYRQVQSLAHAEATYRYA